MSARRSSVTGRPRTQPAARRSPLRFTARLAAPDPAWSSWDHAEAERDVAALLRDAGVPARPPGRLWLLRPPPGRGDLDEAVDRLAAGAEAAGVPLMCCAELVAWSTVTIDGWFGSDA